jgi:DNA-binding beta-propeller fold protein YncE
VTVFDMQSLTEVETIETELGAHTIGWDPATARLYVFAPQRGGALVFSDAA